MFGVSQVDNGLSGFCFFLHSSQKQQQLGQKIEQNLQRCPWKLVTILSKLAQGVIIDFLRIMDILVPSWFCQR